MRMPRGRTQIPYYGQCSENDMSHMQRGPCFDTYGKMDGPCGMPGSEFKSPMMNAEPQPPPTKKKRRASNAMSSAAQPPPSTVLQDLLPPPLSGYGDTIVASNPFDDTPASSMSHMSPMSMNHVNKHMGVGPCMSPAAPMMGSISPCHVVNSPMGCGPNVGSPINCGPPLGNCSPMGGGGNNNCGPIGSPHNSCNNRQVSRSPLVCTPMSTNSVMSNSSMNVNSALPLTRSPSSLGSPLSSVMASNVRGNSPLDCGLGISSVGSQKGSPMSVMNSHNINNMNCGSPMGSPSNVSLNNCNNSSIIGSPITSPLSSVPCSMSGGSDLGINLNGVMNRSPMNAPPISVSSSMMCNSSMRGSSPISTGSLNGPMSMNCNPNSSMVNMGPKSDMNMNELAMREGHLPMKQNNGPGSCGMPVNNVSCTRQSDISGMQCGSMNSPHCNPMMNNQCNPGMNNVQCMGNAINRPQCPPGMGMSMGNPYDGMNPQCRPNMNRSQFPRGMPNVHYGGPNSMNGPMGGPMNGPMSGPMNGPMSGPMNGPMSGPMNGPMGGHMNGLMVGPMNGAMGGPMNGPVNGPMNGPMSGPMNGPNMNMCGPPSDMGSLSCGPNGNPNNMHCVGDPPMNNPQCMSNNMNQCSGPNSMFSSQYSPFDVNNPRCSPNMHFNPNDMNMNSNFYRSNLNSGPCMPNVHPAVCTNSSDVLSVGDSIMSTGTTKNDCRSVDSDIASVVCGITNDHADDLKLISDNLLRDSKNDDRKPMKDFGNRMLLNDENSESKEDDLDIKPSKNDLDSKIADELKLETRRESELDKNEAPSTPNPATTSSSVCTTSMLTTSTCTSTTSTATTSITTSSVTSSATESNNTSEDSKNNNSNKSKENNENDDEYLFKGAGSEAHTNASAHSNNNANENENANDDNVTENKVKDEPTDKLLANEFNDDDEKTRDEKIDSNNDSSSSANVMDEGCGETDLRKENSSASSSGPLIKMESDDFYDANLKNQNDCPGGNGPGVRGNGSGFNNGNMMPGVPPPGNYNVSTSNDVPGSLNNSSACMNDSMCGTTMLPNMNRTTMPNALNHLNYPNRPVAKVYPANKSKVYNSQNPNAPPIYACGNCHKEINDSQDQAILCESGCNFWYHRTCSGLTEAAFQFLNGEIFAEWACDNCLQKKVIPLVKYKP